jgi:acetaldehyde dehydrogenase / alcohol dehydrogenase
MPAPGYSAYIAPDKYAQLGRVIFGGPESAENRHRLFQGVAELLGWLRTPRMMRAAGVTEDESLQALARSAFQDLSNRRTHRCNWLPRSPFCSNWALRKR